MAELARNYYDHLQELDPPTNERRRQNTINEVLGKVDAVLTNQEQTTLERQFEPTEIEEALKATSNGKAAGLDGIPYELWKAIAKESAQHTKKNQPAFDLYGTFAKLYNDVLDHGVAPNTAYADGWIWQKWKEKGSKQGIQYYRPITLLNTDYKLQSKATAYRFAEVAPRLLHPDQAGFVPNRYITDQIKQIKLTIDYAEAIEENGMIIALDQEKAYDKIAHDYLWEVLEHLKTPTKIINLIKNLYRSATSLTIVNGEKSTPLPSHTRS